MKLYPKFNQDEDEDEVSVFWLIDYFLVEAQTCLLSIVSTACIWLIIRALKKQKINFGILIFSLLENLSTYPIKLKMKMNFRILMSYMVLYNIFLAVVQT